MIKSDLEEILEILEKWDFFYGQDQEENYGTLSRENYRIQILRILNKIWIKYLSLLRSKEND